MAYITPNSKIRFHQNIPLDNTYDHTLYFENIAQQITYFSYISSNPSESRIKYQLDNYSYQRHTRNSIRVSLPIENIINCSYMSFQNTSFENKWFYAFITDMEYVNNNTTIVYYEIDVIQTYLFDITFNQCYIERQHTVSDEIGENTQPEPLGACEYVYENATGYQGDGVIIPDYSQLINDGIDTRYQDMSIVVASTFDVTNMPTPEIVYTDVTSSLSTGNFWRRIINANNNWVVPAADPDNTGGIYYSTRGYTDARISIPDLPSGTYVGIAFLKSLNNFMAGIGGSVDYCLNTTELTVTTGTHDYTLPEDCEYIWIEYGVDGVKYTPTYVGLGRLSDIQVEINLYGGLYGGCYSGVQLIDFPATIAGASACTKFLEDVSNVANLMDGIISIFMIPTVFLRTLQTSAPENFSTLLNKYYNWRIGNTAPKNNKIYTAPYTLLHVVSSDGKHADYSFEFSSDPNYIAFLNKGLAMPVSEIELIPENYRGVFLNKNEKFTIDNYPQCSFATDSYKAWLALNSSKMSLENWTSAIGAIPGLFEAAHNFMTGAPRTGTERLINTGVSVAKTIGSNLIEKKLASTMPPQAHGQNTNVLSVADKEFGYHFYYCRPRDEYARIIDDFFTRFGYAINQNAVPNLCARTRFTYIKTIDCTIDANMPNEYSQKFVSIMNNGITFWNDKQHIGNYEIANEVWPG